MIMIEPGTGDVTFANRAADLLAGGAFPRGGVGANDQPIYAGHDAGGARILHPDRPRMRLARGEEVHGVELDWRLPHGTRSLILEGMILPAMHGHTAVGIMTLQDVTRLRQTERENMALLEEAKETARKQRAFLREVMASVTEGRLRICDDQADLPVPGAPYGDMIILDSTHRLRTSRHLATDAAEALGLPPDRSQNLITAISEAAMNAIVHAGGGTVRVYTNGEDMVQVWIEDQGQGIHLDQLPRATLERGYTTAGSLGHGFWLILRTIDRLYLLTGPAGTTVVIEQHRDPPTPAWLAEGH
jgi:anti-sigma regulatory factor (Ser/Thr protein kinase)